MMEIFQNRIKLSEAMRLIVLTHALFAICAGFFFEHKNFDWLSVFLMVLVDGSLLLCLHMATSRVYQQIAMLVLFEVIFFLPRSLSYLSIHQKYLRYNFYTHFEIGDINIALFYIAVGNLILLAGFHTGALLMNRLQNKAWKIPKVPPANFFLFALVFAWLIVYFIDFYFEFVRGVTAYNFESQNVDYLWLIHLFSMDIATFAVLVFALDDRTSSRYLRLTIYSIAVIYIIHLTICGVRSGPVRVCSIYIMYLIVTRGDFKFTLSSAGYFIAILIMTSVIVFPVGTIIRTSIILKSDIEDAVQHTSKDIGLRFGKAENEKFSSSQQINTEKKSTTEQKDITEQKSTKEKESSNQRIFRFVSAIVGRLGILDYPVEIFSGRGNVNMGKRYMNVSYSLKNFVNNILLGTPFPEADIMTSRVLHLIYRNQTEAQIRKEVHTDTWTAWGLCYTLFGIAGGTLALFSMAIVTQVLFSGVMRHTGKYRHVAGVLFLYYWTNNGLLHGHGLDYWLTIAVYTLLAAIITFVLIRIGTNIRNFGKKTWSR